MKKIAKNVAEADGSIVPVLEDEEQKLDELLATAKAEAADRIELAEREAKRELEKLNAEIPVFIEKEREKRIPGIEEETSGLASRLLKEARSAESAVKSRKAAAVQALLLALFGRKI